jgi:hypothetical protein
MPLRQIGKPRQLMMRVGVSDTDLTVHKGVPAEHRAEQRAFTRPVGPEDRSQAAARDVHADMIQRDKASVVYGYVVNAENVV